MYRTNIFIVDDDLDFAESQAEVARDQGREVLDKSCDIEPLMPPKSATSGHFSQYLLNPIEKRHPCHLAFALPARGRLHG